MIREALSETSSLVRHAHGTRERMSTHTERPAVRVCGPPRPVRGAGAPNFLTFANLSDILRLSASS
jgi:hypothetical protein